ncbi:MAG: GerD family protein [Heliobacteriaceae bacterium]|nr:GerD family protein [Heliobacteriaceae bacterium]MDD4588548.1 GerD family protein [Heliobacteriaceae bacterium]
MHRLFWLLIIAFVLISGLTSCSPQGRSAEGQNQKAQQQQQPDYQNLKTMMVDVISTDEYKQRLARMIRDPEFQAMVASQDPQFQKIMQEILRDSKFQEKLALAMKETPVKKALKEMVSDALDDPEIKKKLKTLTQQAKGGGTQDTAGGGQQGGKDQAGDT